MQSINFNQSAEVALMTLNKVNKNLFEVQNQISTGKKVSTAKDNAAIWSISTVMEADAASFRQINESLNLGSATVEVARAAAEQVTTLLQDIKALVVSANEENIDRAAVQRDVEALRDQVESIVDSAQFNGLNLLKGGVDVNLLSSLNRDESDNVSVTEIAVARADLRQTDSTLGTTAIAAGGDGELTLGGATLPLAAGGSETLTFTDFASGTVDAGYSVTVTIGGVTAKYVAQGSESMSEFLDKLISNYEIERDVAEALSPGSTGTFTVSRTAANVITVANPTGATFEPGITAAATLGGTTGGDFFELSRMDVTTDAGVDEALVRIESFIEQAIDDTAVFGSAQNRIETQNTFITSLVSSLEFGISALTDANLEEASARLQALQVQQQLNIQALAIANQAPQALLALFQ